MTTARELLREYDEVLNALPTQAKLYIVGGTVRDMALGVSSKELDLEAHNVTAQEFDDAMKRLGAEGVGKSFFIYKYKNCDIALPRKERKIFVGHKGFKVTLESDIKTACERRDFTINSMLYNPTTDELIDFFGGLNDLKSKTLRVVNPKTFIEDSLRVLRGAQFCARFGLRIEPLTLTLCKTLDLSDLTSERIWQELEKLFMASHKTIGLYYLFKLGVAQKLWGITEDKKLFSALKFIKKSKNNPLIYAYVLMQFWNVPPNKVLKFAPKSWLKEMALHPKKPHIVNNRFLAGLSLKLAPKAWMGGNFNGEINNFGITAKSVMAQGFSGAEISRQIKLQRAKIIRN